MPSRDLPALNRRSALTLMSAATLGGALALPRRAHAAAAAATVNLPAPSKTDHDVIVVGAGFAGVTAARELSRAGLSTLVLEARNRVGGRTFTNQFAGDQIEMGGTWIHWSQPHVWAEMTRYGLSLKESPGAMADVTSWIAGGRLNRAQSEKIMPELAALMDRFHDVDGQHGRAVMPMAYDVLAARDALGKWDRLSMDDRLRQLKLSATQRDMLSPLMSIDCHNDPKQGGLLSQLQWWALGDHDFFRMFDKLGRYKIGEGMNALSASILNDSRAELLLSTPVQSISQTDRRATVTTRGAKAFTASAVVMAVPMNTLADVAFTPALSQVKLDMSKARHTGSGIKAYVHVKQKIGKWFGMAPYPSPITMAWTEHERDDGTVIVVFGPPNGPDITDEEAVQAALRQLLPKVDVLAVTGYQWNADPYSKGTWCFYRPGQLTQGLRGMQAAEGALFFAGGDIANGWRGFVDGAIETGLASARQVRIHLNK
jgi:monoamine oxidase